MRLGSYRLQVDSGHLLLLIAIAGFAVWYARDARRASPFIENTILILPATILTVALAVMIVPQAVRLSRAEPADRPAAASRFALRAWFAQHREERIALLLMLLLGGFVASAAFIGFDVATFLFLAGTLLALGERRWWVVSAFSLLLSGILIGAMKAGLPLDLPTTVL